MSRPRMHRTAGFVRCDTCGHGVHMTAEPTRWEEHDGVKVVTAWGVSRGSCCGRVYTEAPEAEAELPHSLGEWEDEQVTQVIGGRT